MISYINGILKSKQEGEIIVDNNGIGYQIFVSNNTLSSLSEIGEIVDIFTYLQLREDAIVLYGFSTMEEKNLFLKLINVSDIGPKKAIGILSGMNLSDLLVAIASNDFKSLSKIKGLGAKTAERLCLELKDKVDVLNMPNIANVSLPTKSLEDAVEALINLGINRNHALEMAREVAKENSTVEEIITDVLQNMGR